MLLFLWLCALLWRCQSTESFVLWAGDISRWKIRADRSFLPLEAMNIRELLKKTTSGTGNNKVLPSSNSDGATPEIASTLASVLRMRPQKKAISDQDRSQTISLLVQQLIDARVTFDPKVCLNDSVLYKSHVVNGPIPLWQQLGIFAESRNLQGQQYNFDAGTVINYAEILGKGTLQSAIVHAYC